jgi:benzil reductase ((S)-benzoin forming)
LNLKTVIITGVSSGIGKALAELYLDKGVCVIGIGRTNSLKAEKFQFIQADLSVQGSVDKLNLPQLTSPVLLINNAGSIGVIGRISDTDDLKHSETFQLNVLSPLELTRKVYRSVTNKSEFTLVNISSGAAKSSIPSWSVYCASKAALNMWTDCFFKEELEKGLSPKVYCVAPGVVDTQMQSVIRSASQDDFSSLEKFVRLKADDLLFSADEVAKRLEGLLSLPYEGIVHYDLREIKPLNK